MSGILECIPTKKAAALLGVEPQSLRRWRCEGRGPRFVRYGGPRGRVVYPIKEIEVFLASRLAKSTSEESIRLASREGA
jgi:hypothetical protein